VQDLYLNVVGEVVTLSGPILGHGETTKGERRWKGGENWEMLDGRPCVVAVIEPGPLGGCTNVAPVRLSASLSVRLSVSCPPLIRKPKTVQYPNLEEILGLHTSEVTDRRILRSER